MVVNRKGSLHDSAIDDPNHASVFKRTATRTEANVLRHILFDVDLFSDEAARENSQKRVLILLNALTWCDQLWLREHPETPLIYQSGIKYVVPEQYEKAELPEISTVRDWLKKKDAPMDVQVAFGSMADQLGSGEHFREIHRIIENGGGDCLPIETLVQSFTDKLVYPIGRVKVGDLLCDIERKDGTNCARVDKVWSRSSKQTVTLYLGNKTRLVSSLDHRHMRYGGVEVRAEDLRVGDVLLQKHGVDGLKIEGIEPSGLRECVDITTSTGTFWLPETNVVTHNCDNVATWRSAELRELGIGACPFITWRRRPDGGMTYHVLVRWPDNTLEDPSLILGMGGEARAPDRAEEIRKLGERTKDFVAALRVDGLKAQPESIFGLPGARETVLGHGHGGHGHGGRGGGRSHDGYDDDGFEIDYTDDDDLDDALVVRRPVLVLGGTSPQNRIRKWRARGRTA